jgi:hypothetical protein
MRALPDLPILVDVAERRFGRRGRALVSFATDGRGDGLWPTGQGPRPYFKRARSKAYACDRPPGRSSARSDEGSARAPSTTNAQKNPSFGGCTRLERSPTLPLARSWRLGRELPPLKGSRRTPLMPQIRETDNFAEQSQGAHRRNALRNGWETHARYCWARHDGIGI